MTARQRVAELLTDLEAARKEAAKAEKECSNERTNLAAMGSATSALQACEYAFNSIT